LSVICYPQGEWIVKTHSSLGLVLALSATIAVGAPPLSNGPDLIVGELSNVINSGNDSTYAGVYVTTVSCNAGRVPAKWFALPRIEHPVITQNMFRLNDGVLKQIGQSGVKHGFTALQQPGVCSWECTPHADGTALGSGCADPYEGSLIGIVSFTGSRMKINPATGTFDGQTAASPGPAPLGWDLRARHTDLQTPNARYFVEGQYIAADDSAAANSVNNVSYREVAVSGTTGKWSFRVVGDTQRGCPAIVAWPNAKLTALDVPNDGRIIVGVVTTMLQNGRQRVDVGVYNMTSEKGLRALSIPRTSGIAMQSIGFYSPETYGDSLFHDAWRNEVTADRITWRTQSFSENPLGNALRWSQLFNFWFETSTPQILRDVELLPYKGSDDWIRLTLTGDYRCDPNAYR
jgi:hypothetical protein